MEKKNGVEGKCDTIRKGREESMRKRNEGGKEEEEKRRVSDEDE